MAATRTSISFDENNWNRLLSAPNRSKVVNEAVDFFYRSKAFLKEKEEEFILGELTHYQTTGEHYTFEETFKD